MKKFAAFAIAASFFLASAPTYAQCSAAEAKALEALDRSWGEMGRAGDRAGIDAIYSPNYNTITPYGVTGKAKALDQVVAQAAADRKRPPRVETTHDHYVISCTPHSATITHRNVSTPTAGGVPTYSRSIHFVEKRDGKYLVASSVFVPVTDEMQIEYLEREWSDADASGNKTWHAANLADDYHGVSSRTGKVSTKEEEIADVPSLTFTSAEVSDVEVLVAGDLAVATGMWTGIGVDKDKKSATRKVRYTDTFRKRDGRWIAVASQGTTVLGD